MDKLELYTSELFMLKELLECDIRTNIMGGVEYDDYANVELMQYYLDRAKVLAKVEEVLAS